MRLACLFSGVCVCGENRYAHPTLVLRKITGRTSPTEWKPGRLCSAPHTQMMEGLTSPRLSPCSYWGPCIHTLQYIGCKSFDLLCLRFFSCYK